MDDDTSEALLGDIAENIAEIAATRKMGLHILADFSGIARSTIFRVMKGDYDIGIVRLNRIAQALDVELAKLVSRRTRRR